MDLFNIILIIVIIAILLKFYNNNKQSENFIPTKFEETNNISNKPNGPNQSSQSNQSNAEKNFETNCVERMCKIKNTNKKNKLVKSAKLTKSDHTNPYFQEIQFHQDYRDTLNAFNLLSDQKKVFNKSDTPILKVSIPPTNEVTNLIERFVKELNKTTKNNVGDVAGQNLNTWNDNLPTTNLEKKEDGWEKYMKDLGLPPSIYPEPAEKSKIKLIKIDHVEKIETSSETKYSVHIILQKKNVSDQMIVKICFVIDNSDINLDRDFFKNEKNSYETSVTIEEISIEGFLIKQGFGNTTKTYRQKRSQFENFDGFTDGRMISDNEIIKQLNNKKREIKENFVRGT